VGRDLVLSGAEVGFAKGNLTLAGSLPLQLEPFSIGPESAPLALDVAATGIDLTDFASLLPSGSTLRGRFDGHVALGGTVGEPRLRGQTTVAGGVLETPFERQPLTNIAAALDFRERGARLVSLHAEAGGGSVDASGRVRFADLTRPTTDASYSFEARAKALRLDLPEFGRGTIDGSLSLTHAPGELPTLTAAATMQDGVIPFSALLLAAGSASSGPPESVIVAPAGADGTGPSRPGDVRLALSVTAGRNVRVRSGNVDIGGRGALSITGTRFAPVLSGGFDSTGGTLTYFNTLFRVQRGTVTFEPDLGVVPELRAVATTHVTDPDPNPTRNLSGFADISLDITGPVTNLAINLTSDPPYGREQILGLLLSAPQLGATNLFDPNSSIQPLGVLPAGQTGPNGGRTLAGLEAQRPATAPGDIFATTVGEEAFGVVNAQFTRNLLAPFETAFSDAIGLSAVNINVDYTGNVGLTARKILGKTVNAIYATTFGYPYRQSVGFELRPSASTAAQLTVFQTIGNEILGLGVPNTIILPSNSRIGAGEPAYGTIGFSLSVQRFLR
jgi:translocation and assembly module TamB